MVGRGLVVGGRGLAANVNQEIPYRNLETVAASGQDAVVVDCSLSDILAL